MFSWPVSSISSCFRHKKVQKVVLAAALGLLLYFVYLPFEQLSENGTLYSNAVRDVESLLDNPPLGGNPLNPLPAVEEKTLREMLSEELDYSLDQVEYFKRNSKMENLNGVFVALVRNKELDQMVHTIKEIERSFNAKYQYPYLFLNDAPFTQEFIQKISQLTKAKVEFGLDIENSNIFPLIVNNCIHL